MTILQNHYVLAVHDVRKSAEFYVGALGFDQGGQPLASSGLTNRMSRLSFLARMHLYE